MLTPPLPAPRGPISAGVFDLLQNGRWLAAVPHGRPVADDDLHLALYCLYELHYRGFRDVDPSMEWNPAVLGVRQELEERFIDELRRQLPDRRGTPAGDAPRLLQQLIDDADGPSLSRWTEEHGELAHLQELALHRSAYQLKEADPHTWALPRLPAGRAKSAMLALQFDEYGNGEPGRSHAELFATTLASLDLSPVYGRYLDHLPGVTLATVNLASYLGLHREHLAACIGHLAVFEMTSVVPMSRYSDAHRRVTGDPRGREFYDVHVAADAEHELIARDVLVPELLLAQPELAADLLFGADALMLVERRFAEHVLAAWDAGRSSLLPVPWRRSRPGLLAIQDPQPTVVATAS